MDVIADPDVDAFFLNELAAQRVGFEVGAFEVSTKACIAGRLRFIFKPENEFAGGRFDAFTGSVKLSDLGRAYHLLQQSHQLYEPLHSQVSMKVHFRHMTIPEIY